MTVPFTPKVRRTTEGGAPFCLATDRSARVPRERAALQAYGVTRAGEEGHQ